MMCLPSVAIVRMCVFLTQDRVPRKQGIVLVHLCARSRCTGEVFTEHLLWTQPSLCACICKAALLNSQEERELGRMEEMPADAAGAPGPVHSPCTHRWNPGTEAVVRVSPDPLRHSACRAEPPVPRWLPPRERGDSPIPHEVWHRWLSLVVTYPQPGPASSGKWGWSVQGVEGTCEFCQGFFSLSFESRYCPVSHVRAMSVSLGRISRGHGDWL